MAGSATALSAAAREDVSVDSSVRVVGTRESREPHEGARGASSERASVRGHEIEVAWDEARCRDGGSSALREELRDWPMRSIVSGTDETRKNAVRHRA